VSVQAGRTAAVSERAFTDPSARVKVGMACFLCSEAAFFCSLIIAYIFYLGHNGSGPQAAEVLDLEVPLAGTVFLVSSSGTIILAVRSLSTDRLAGFVAWLGATVLLAAGFLVGTGIEWQKLIEDDGVTISRNLFGSTYYTLVGFHAFHVTIGAVVMVFLLAAAVRGALSSRNSLAVEMVSWYWHFVDVVWIFVLSTVYFLPRA
jgi:cytochrome c oxidase subunit 3